MKITARQLRRIISETCGVSLEKSSGVVYGDGGPAGMARSQLFQIATGAAELHDMLHDDDELPEWVQSKIAVMSHSMDAVLGHIEYKYRRELVQERVGGADLYDDDDYYERRIQDEREELYLDDLNALKGIVEKYGAVDIQRLMGDVKKERFLARYDFKDIEDMLDELYNNDEIDYDEGSGQWVAV